LKNKHNLFAGRHKTIDFLIKTIDFLIIFDYL
jgi:hypothetical protein